MIQSYSLPSEQEILSCSSRINLVVVTPLGRSGSMLLQSLLDGHPAIAVNPHVAQAYDYMESFEKAGHNITKWLNTNPEFYMGFTQSEDQLSRNISVFFEERREQFETLFRHISSSLGGAKTLDGRKLIATLAMSWTIIRGQNIDDLSYAVFHHHNNRRIALDMPDILKHFPDVKVLVSCRHPIESALSFKTQDERSGTDSFRNYSRNVRGWSVKCWRNVEKVINQYSRDDNVRLLDLNSLHNDPDSVLTNLASWLDIENHESLHQSTVSGVPWLGNSADGKPIATFDKKRSVLIYPTSISSKKGLTLDEYSFAEYFTRAIRDQAGYPDDLEKTRIGLLAFVFTAARNIEFFKKDVIGHDQGWKKMVRRFGYSEFLLVVIEILSQKLTQRKSMQHLRLDAPELKESDLGN